MFIPSHNFTEVEMAVRVNFEIGHKASVRTKRTLEGFTHDWEVFVRGHEDANISHFVEKVVFHLHETFPKPKREVKKPPYTIKESGYGSFTLPIDIYLKNKDEPKKIKFSYELSLQDSGHMKDRYIFQNPSEEFKKKLIKGGGFLISNHQVYSNPEQDRSRDSFLEDKMQLYNKPKLTAEVKKHKTKDYRDDLPKPSNTFQNLFGSPIHKPPKVIPEPKKIPVPAPAQPPPPPPPVAKLEKKEKDRSSTEKEKKSKHEHRDKGDKIKAKDDREKVKEEKSKAYAKDEKVKEKFNKRPSERPASPSPTKKPRVPSPKRSISPCNKSNSSINDEIKPFKAPLEQQDIKKIKTEEKNVELKEKKKKDKKSHDKDKDRSKKEHKKENIKVKEEESLKELPKPKELPREIPREVSKEKRPEKVYNKFSIENFKAPNESLAQKPTEDSKLKEKPDGERKHKHKKKDKKRDESHEKHKDREKKHKHDKKGKESLEQKEYVPDKPIEPPIAKEKPVVKEPEPVSPISLDTSSQASSKGSRSKFLNATGVEDITSSSQSDSDDSMAFENEKIFSKNTLTKPASPKIEVRPPSPKTESQIPAPKIENSPGPSTKEKKKHKDKSKSKEERKQKKRKSSSKKEDDDAKVSKVGEGSRPRGEGKPKSETKLQDNGVSSSLGEDGPNSAPSSPEPEIEREELPPTAELSPEYMNRLKELQQKIINIKRNDDLERVVNLIAETGRYEVTTHTFDFDLCLLDKSTVQQLINLVAEQSC